MKNTDAQRRVFSKNLDLSPERPIYQQVAAFLRSQIADETWPPGRKIPSEPALARQFGLSVLTVRQAIGQLVDEGLLEREQGRGTFVVGLDWRKVAFSLGSITDLVNKKEHLKMRLLKMHMEKVGPDMAQTLGLPESSRVISIRRLLLLSGRPHLLQHSLLRPDPRLPVVESDLSLVSVADFFSSGHNMRLKKARLNLEAEVAQGEDAEQLGLASGQPAYRLKYIFFDFSDNPLGCGWLLMPTASIKFESDLGLWS